MIEQKNYFNDLRPEPEITVWSCCDCRVTVEIKVKRYPHGPDQVVYCPICANTEITEIK